MALRLCAMALLKSGDEVCVEDPGYPGARSALTATGATVRPVPVDDEGLVIRSIGSKKRSGRVTYVTPSHQYPLGMSMSASRRLELLEWARRYRSWIIEDDYDSEYRFASRPLAALQGMDTASRVIYVGTFSKVLFPALRIGYLVVPRSLMRTFVDHREALDIFSPTLYQAVLRDFIIEGHSLVIFGACGPCISSGGTLVSGIQHKLHEKLTIANADAGMHLTAWLSPGINDREVVRRAAARVSAPRRFHRATRARRREWVWCLALAGPMKHRSTAPSKHWLRSLECVTRKVVKDGEDVTAEEDRS
jgi:GntR family transcriptional regulator/MocR family aminotransferase